MNRFGMFIHEQRINNGLKLRQFCRATGFDASNWSKIERGILPPPKKKEDFEKIAKTLCFKKGSEEWHNLFELAAISHIPKDLIIDESLKEALPVLFRTVRGKKLSWDKVEKILDLIAQE